MKITQVSDFTFDTIVEGLNPGEHYVWNVNFADGSSQKVNVGPGVGTKDVIEHFAKQGKQVSNIDYDFGIQGSGSNIDSQQRGEYHRAQDDLEKKTRVQGQHFFEEEAEVRAKWQELNELSVDKLRAYRDATATPRTTDRLGKVVKHTRGHAQAVNKIAKATGDKTPNREYSRAMEEDEMLNEISNEVLSKYKSAAGADASKANKEGDMKRGDKRFHGIVQATKKQFSNDAKKHVEEDFTNILNKQHADAQAAKPKAKTVEVPYHGWTIRYRPASTQGEQVPWQVMDRKGEVKFRSEAATDKDAVRDAEAWINKGGDAKQQATSNVTVDFNVNFAREIVPEGGDFYATIDKDGDTPMLIVSLEPQKGLKKSHVRNQKHKMTATTTPLPCISLSAREANALGLQANGRYTLGPKDEIDDHTFMFPLIFQSVVQGKGDMMRMGSPGLTIAHNRD